jgi:light-regulated signal transduction histidine kinase (bacteriophytochrome)
MSSIDADASETNQQGQNIADLMLRLEEIEARVSLVTGERDALNKEMEDLARFLSHDLRAPLRGIDGYSKALMEDYGEKLDQVGMAYLQFIVDAGHQAARLIDRLIYFIRVRQAEIQIQTINLSQLASDLITHLNKSQPDRNISWVIAPDLCIQGDFKMIRELLSILLENAWKFTSKHSTACVEVGQVQIEGRDVFFVQDDGAGFNMDYLDRLFQPFQRLHNSKDFEGAGMGLAIARRIIERHQGRIWGEGKIDQGATFYFIINGEAIQKGDLND